MAKYSTGGAGGGDDGDACELCGAESPKLQRANVAGADLLVCPDCAPMSSNKHKDEKKRERAKSQRDQSESSRKKRAAQNTAKVMDANTGDSKHWEEEGTNYEEDRLPYLVADYGETAMEARQSMGLTVEELAAETGLDEDDVLAIEQGRATRAGVGGSAVRTLEEFLQVDLVDE